MPLLTTGTGAYPAAGGGGGNVVTIDRVATAFAFANSVTGILNSDLTISASLSNPALVAVFLNCGGVSLLAPVATWDYSAAGGAQQPMTLLRNQDAGGGLQVLFFGLRNPRPGNWNLGLVFGATCSGFLHAMSLYNVNPASDAAAFTNFTGTSSGAAPQSIVVPTGANNFAVAGFVNGTNYSSVNNTQWLLNNTGATWAVASNYAASAGASVTMTASPGGATGAAAGGCIVHD